MKNSFYIAFILTVGLVVPCAAQDSLSLQQAVAKALQSRASLKAEAERISAAEGLKKQAGLIPNPEFQFQNENLRPGQTYGRDVDTLAMINQPLDVLGKRRQRVALAGEGVSRTQAEYELARWQVAQQSEARVLGGARLAGRSATFCKTTVDNFQKIIDYHAAQLSAGRDRRAGSAARPPGRRAPEDLRGSGGDRCQSRAHGTA